MELYNGCANRAQVRSVNNLLQRFHIVWPTSEHCDQLLAEYPTLWLARGMQELDALVAASALSQNNTLYTFNTKHFRAVPGPHLQQPYTK
jgi:predicted nucleic acid-binding protein